MTNIRLKLAPPWVTYVNEVKALFDDDPQVHVVYDNDTVELKLYVEDAKKAEAIQTLLPENKQFGNVSLTIKVIPANVGNYDFSRYTFGRLFDVAFDGNPVYSFSKDIDSVFMNVLTYVVFTNKVVQFFNDNLNDIYGNVTTLYQEIASDVFDIESGVFFCTDFKKEVTNERQWP